jgi:hypothetical protein
MSPDEFKARDPAGVRGRRLVTMRTRIVLLIFACGLALSMASAARPSTNRGTCGPALCAPKADGWFTSVGTGAVNSRPAAWILVGNFRFPVDAAGQEGTPAVPPGKVLIAFSDFPVVSAYARWRRVMRLHLPTGVPVGRSVVWHVRFAGRAVYVRARFGSQPTVETWQLANAKLKSVYRKRQ